MLVFVPDSCFHRMQNMLLLHCYCLFSMLVVLVLLQYYTSYITLFMSFLSLSPPNLVLHFFIAEICSSGGGRSKEVGGGSW